MKMNEEFLPTQRPRAHHRNPFGAATVGNIFFLTVLFLFRSTRTPFNASRRANIVPICPAVPFLRCALLIVCIVHHAARIKQAVQRMPRLTHATRS